MATVQIVQFKSFGFPGAPGFTNLAFSGGTVGGETTPFAVTYDFLQAVKAVFPSNWSAQIETAAKLLDSGTGALTGYTPCPSEFAGVIQGTSSTKFGAGVAGACIAWGTGTIAKTRRVRGRTFLVPLSTTDYATDGRLEPGVISACEAAAAALIGSTGGFGIWSRPVNGAGGVFAPATSARVNPEVAFLSTRRS